MFCFRAESNLQVERERRIKEKKPVYELKKEEWSINHLHAGFVFINLAS